MPHCRDAARCQRQPRSTMRTYRDSPPGGGVNARLSSVLVLLEAVDDWHWSAASRTTTGCSWPPSRDGSARPTGAWVAWAIDGRAKTRRDTKQNPQSAADCAGCWLTVNHGALDGSRKHSEPEWRAVLALRGEKRSARAVFLPRSSAWGRSDAPRRATTGIQTPSAGSVPPACLHHTNYKRQTPIRPDPFRGDNSGETEPEQGRAHIERAEEAASHPAQPQRSARRLAPCIVEVSQPTPGSRGHVERRERQRCESLGASPPAWR